jgi:serine/threonine protein kinase
MRGISHNLRLLHAVSGLVHADLKPGNLVIKVKPRCLRLIDFGTSWQIERTRNRVAGDGFDPIYAAPELLCGNAPLMESADQFSVGVLFYQLLTLKLPYVGLGGRVGFHQSAAERDSLWEAPSAFVADRDRIPPSILKLTDELCYRMLRIEPRDRFPNSRAWSNAFDQLQVRIQQATFDLGDSHSLLDRFYQWWARREQKIRSPHK